MPTFTFSAYSDEGMEFRGVRKAESEEKLREHLKRGKLMPIIVAQTSTRYSEKPYSSVCPKELSIFCKQASVLFYSQVTLLEGVSLLSEQADNWQLKAALDEINAHMSAGHSFAEAIGMYDNVFPKYLLSMIRIGEQAGTLDTVFSQMSGYYERESRIRKKLKSAIINPLILTALTFAVVLLLILKIVPMFNGILNSIGGEIPAATKLIVSVCGSFARSLPIITIAVVLIIILFMNYKKTKSGRRWFDKMSVKLPYIGFINKRVIITRYSRSLSLSLKYGAQLLNSVAEANTIVDNSYLERHFDNAANDVKDGGGLSEALEQTRIFPELYLKMVSLGSKAGHLDEMLDKTADIYEEELDDSIESVTQLVEPVMTILLAIAAGVILISVMLPMIDIMNSIAP